MGRDLFPVTLFGQTVVAMSQVFVLGVPPNVAAVWFGADQVSSACSIGVFGNQVSCPNVNNEMIEIRFKKGKINVKSRKERSIDIK